MLQPNFNPRSHEGSDDYSLVFAGDYGISIRAPTRGATCNPRNNGILVDFNPRSHEGSDSLPGCLSCWACDFNPRSHEGSDPCGKHLLYNTNRFQSALPRGERLEAFDPSRLSMQFQSALPRGERLCQSIYHWYSCIFQSALPRGERHQFSPKSSLLS